MLKLLTVNDIYQFDAVNRPHGGYARIATLFQDHRDDDTLVFVNGDFLGGSQLSVLSTGEAACRVLEECLKPHYVVIGNHEFDFGRDRLEELMLKYSSFVWLGSNVRDRDSGELLTGLTEYDVREINGFRIGLT